MEGGGEGWREGVRGGGRDTPRVGGGGRDTWRDGGRGGDHWCIYTAGYHVPLSIVVICTWLVGHVLTISLSQSLQMAIFLYSVCHVVMVMVDSTDSMEDVFK